MQVVALVVFLITVILVLWRPGGIHEAVPALIGAFGMFIVGLIDRHDVLRVMAVVGNSATTIIATFVMASVLEGAGFFRWATERLVDNADGSQRRLFHLCLAFMTCLTLFLNNDGAILLGMPVILGIVQGTRMSKRAQFVFLIASGLIASATSSVIGVSNMANLEAMGLVGISLLVHLREIWFPGLLGIGAAWCLFDRLLRNEPAQPQGSSDAPGKERVLHPLRPREGDPPAGRKGPPRPPVLRPHHHLQPHPLPRPGGIKQDHPWSDVEPRRKGAPPPNTPWMMWAGVFVIVVVRVGFFIASATHLPNAVVAAAGAILLLTLNAFNAVVKPSTTLRQAPWSILGFAFGLDLVVFGLRNASITGTLANWIGPIVGSSVLGLSFLPGFAVAVLSSSLNNHPALIVGSLTLLEIVGLSKASLNVAYAGIVLGSDLGGLMTPVGTLASLLWFHVLRQYGFRYAWSDYLRVSLVVIPISLALSLGGLYMQSILIAR